MCETRLAADVGRLIVAHDNESESLLEVILAADVECRYSNLVSVALENEIESLRKSRLAADV